ncbi:DNA cytosine methyltransferase [Parafrankia sp. EUN1f]|uniref:DNA cytosine methyltransferase n=1 Tax=Parafrankia sp. EUN1f TaxID=102897 RepID=UPI0001C44DAC|nr:DNA-cytosine methyltransferase [Parafrankia sp. EUN1f]
MPRSVELFAGGGGMALGMRDAGFEHEQLIEREPRPVHVLLANAARNPWLWKAESVVEADVLDWLEDVENLELDDIDLVAGGPPCQPFSISGAHAGHNDVRNMFPSAIETVRRLRPKLFVFENVPGLLRPSFLPYYNYISDQLAIPEVTPRDGESWMEHHARVRRSHSDGLRYHVYRQLVNAADLGVGQERRRVFLVGMRWDIRGADSWSEISPTHSRDSLLRDQWITGEYWERHRLAPEGESPVRLASRIAALRQEKLEFSSLPAWKTTREVLLGLPDPIDDKEHPKVLNHKGIPGARTYKGHTGGLFDWPAKTLKAGVHGVCGGEAMIRFRDGSLRYLTIRESARVQSFPDDYEVPGTRTAAMRVLGNAVAVDVAAAIGSALRAHTGL